MKQLRVLKAQAAAAELQQQQPGAVLGELAFAKADQVVGGWAPPLHLLGGRLAPCSTAGRSRCRLCGQRFSQAPALALRGRVGGSAGLAGGCRPALRPVPAPCLLQVSVLECLAAAGCHSSKLAHRAPLQHLLHSAFKPTTLKRNLYGKGDDFVNLLWLLHRLGLWLPRQGAVLDVGAALAPRRSVPLYSPHALPHPLPRAACHVRADLRPSPTHIHPSPRNSAALAARLPRR
jgi:hypothetical protein